MTTRESSRATRMRTRETRTTPRATPVRGSVPVFHLGIPRSYPGETYPLSPELIAESSRKSSVSFPIRNDGRMNRERTGESPSESSFPPRTA